MPKAWMATKSHFCELTVEPGHLDIHQFAPGLGRLLALGAPGGLQAGVGKRGFQGLFRLHELVGHGWIETGGGHVGPGHAKHAGAEDEIAAILFNFGFGVRHLGSLAFAPKPLASGRFRSLKRPGCSRFA
jgi:hypothetical protein